MIRTDRYRCHFLDSTGLVCSRATIVCGTEGEAVELALKLWRSKPSCYGIELWQGPTRLHMDVRMPEPLLTLAVNES
jgi:hypothetical protein